MEHMEQIPPQSTHSGAELERFMKEVVSWQNRSVKQRKISQGGSCLGLSQRKRHWRNHLEETG